MKLFILFFTFFFSSCNIFETRDPESPDQVSSNFVPPTEPSLVFMNMSNAFKDLNAVNYARSFSDSSSSGRTFRFEPTTQARTRYAGVFSSWTKQSEQQYFENIRSRITQGSISTLSFTFSAQTLSSDSAFFEATYSLSIPHQRTTIPKEGKGRAQFHLLMDKSGNWSIWRWIDLSNAQNDFSWSDFKGEFGQ